MSTYEKYIIIILFRIINNFLDKYALIIFSKTLAKTV